MEQVIRQGNAIGFKQGEDGRTTEREIPLFLTLDHLAGEGGRVGHGANACGTNLEVGDAAKMFALEVGKIAFVFPENS